MPKRVQLKSRARTSTWSRAASWSAAAASLLPLPCAADSEDPFIHGRLSLGAGIFFGYQFATEPARSGFEWGFEAYATQRYGDVGECTSGNRVGFGPIVQLGIKGVEDPRLTLAMRAGTELARPLLAFTAELGASYRFGHDPGASIHLGFVPEVSMLTAAVRHQLLRGETWVGGGLRYLPSFGEQGLCSEGRPLRLQDGKCSAAMPQLLPAQDDAALAAAAFAADAQMECISITAFVQLALELMAVSAPHALVQRAWSAAEDELRHTRLCAGIAERLGSTHVACSLPQVNIRPAASRAALLERIAVESYEDGCVGEGAAASQLTRSAHAAADSGIAKTLRAIARDEAAHARLAWDVLSFCVAEGGEPVRAALRACRERVRDLTWQAEHAPDLQRFGRMPPHEFAELARAQVQRAHVRALHLT